MGKQIIRIENSTMSLEELMGLTSLLSKGFNGDATPLEEEEIGNILSKGSLSIIDENKVELKII